MHDECRCVISIVTHTCHQSRILWSEPHWTIKSVSVKQANSIQSILYNHHVCHLVLVRITPHNKSTSLSRATPYPVDIRLTLFLLTRCILSILFLSKYLSFCNAVWCWKHPPLPLSKHLLGGVCPNLCVFSNPRQTWWQPLTLRRPPPPPPTWLYRSQNRKGLVCYY